MPAEWARLADERRGRYLCQQDTLILRRTACEGYVVDAVAINAGDPQQAVDYIVCEGVSMAKAGR